MPYSWLHYLRRAYAYARQTPGEFGPLADGADATDDARLDYELSAFRSHLVCHSDTDGYYVPVDFPEPLLDETDAVVGGVFGSSQAAMRELVAVAPLLDIRLRDGALSDADAQALADEDGGPLYIERQVWLTLFESFRLSIEHGAAVRFG